MSLVSSLSHDGKAMCSRTQVIPVLSDVLVCFVYSACVCIISHTTEEVIYEVPIFKPSWCVEKIPTINHHASIPSTGVATSVFNNNAHCAGCKRTLSWIGCYLRRARCPNGHEYRSDRFDRRPWSEPRNFMYWISGPLYWWSRNCERDDTHW